MTPALKLADKTANATTIARKTANKTSSNASIQQNAFFQAYFDPSTDLAEKQAALTALLISTKDKEKDKLSLAALAEFKAYLQEQRESNALRIIELSDPETFSVLRDSYDIFNTLLLEFEKDVMPFTETIEALHILSESGQAIDAVREIKEDIAKEVENKAKTEALIADIKSTSAQIEANLAKKAGLAQKKTMFGFGSITAEAAQSIKAIELENTRLLTDMAIKEENKKALATTVARESIVVDQDAKNKLRDMLNLSSPEHKERSQKMLDSALAFVRQSKGQLGLINEKLSGVDEQISRLESNTSQLSMVYAVLNESAKEAETINLKMREELVAPKDNENMVQKINRETALQNSNRFIAELSAAKADTQVTVADMVTQTIRINNMGDATKQQKEAVTVMATSGIAGVADRLAAVVTAIGSAATNEANAIAAQTMRAMRENTDIISQKQGMQNATGLINKNSELERAIESLQQYSDVSRQSNAIVREAQMAARDHLQEMSTISSELSLEVKNAMGISADIAAGVSAVGSVKTNNTNVNPFS